MNGKHVRGKQLKYMSQFFLIPTRIKKNEKVFSITLMEKWKKKKNEKYFSPEHKINVSIEEFLLLLFLLVNLLKILVKFL